jgi:Hemerythrin HHE cation binding domain
MPVNAKILQKTIGEVRARRQRLRIAMDRLEFALAAPAPGRESAWLEGVRAAFRDLAAALTDHVAEVEAMDGLFAQVRADAPRLASKIRELEVEHGELAAAARSLGERLAAAGGEEGSFGLRRELIRLLGRLAHHRQAGADLLYEAYVVDVSLGD